MKIPARAVLCTAMLITVSGTVDAAAISGQGTWETTLQGRDLNGNGIFDAYYDTVLNITWLADANYAGTDMTWADANAWAAGLNIHGTTGWRLPDTNPVNGTSYNVNYATDGSTDVGFNISAPGTVYAGSTASELAHLFYNTLGNLGQLDTSGNVQAGGGLSNTGPFSNVQSNRYWSATEYVVSTCSTCAWSFRADVGSQWRTINDYNFYAWAVHAGDVGASEVPVPAAVWLFASGLLGLMGVSRKRQRC